MDGISQAHCWADVQARNRAADGSFVYSVRSTGVYCRPSCPSRPARRENVAFHADCAAAEAAGFRACQRCDPRGDRPSAAAAMAAACRTIEAAETPPAIAVLARRAGLSSSHFRRLFQAATGLTPKAYAVAHRAGRVRVALTETASVTEAVYAAGFNAASRFYAAAPAMLGMSPTVWRRGGAGLRIQFAIAPCTLGMVLAAATPRGVCAIELGDTSAELHMALRRRFPRAAVEPAGGDFTTMLDRVVALIDRGHADPALPLDIQGTAFQHRVWQALREIPAGETASYAGIAARIGAPGAARAVAGACGANPVAIAIPCHRVVRGTAELAGYRWGIERKRTLLNREAKKI